MQLEDLVAYCLAKSGAEETYPWGDGELVAKVGGKAFAFIGLGSRSVGVKCGRDAAEAAGRLTGNSPRTSGVPPETNRLRGR